MPADGDDERGTGHRVGHHAAAQAEHPLDERLGDDLRRSAGGDDPAVQQTAETEAADAAEAQTDANPAALLEVLLAEFKIKA